MQQLQRWVFSRGILQNGLKDSFVFVNLDVNLYEPTYNGLMFFKDKMIKGGF